MKIQNRITSNDQRTSEKLIERKNDSEITKTIPIPEKIPKPSASLSGERDCDESIINQNTNF